MGSGNCVEWILLQLGCAMAGVVLVNVNPAYRAFDLGYVLRKSRMRALFLRERDARADYTAILEKARRGQDLALEHVVLFDHNSWHGMLARGGGLDAGPRPSDIANIQYTSGTTGSPKGVLLTHRNLVNNAWSIGEWMKVTPADRMCVPLPLYHCAGCICSDLAMLIRGAAVILPSAQFDVGAVLAAMHSERATLAGMVPTMLVGILDHPSCGSYDLSRIRQIWAGGSPTPIELMRRATARMPGARVWIIYGQTEPSPLITMAHPDDSTEQCISTIGRAALNTEVKIIATTTGETVAAGEQGELCTRGYHVMQGYDEDPEATARTVDRDGWLHTGDLATMDPDEPFHITGRAKDMTIRGGENLFPAEIEAFLMTHPKVSDVCVIGLPDRKLGEAVLAWIRLRPGQAATEDEIRDFCDGKIQRFKIRDQEIAERGLAELAGARTA